MWPFIDSHATTVTRTTCLFVPAVFKCRGLWNTSSAEFLFVAIVQICMAPYTFTVVVEFRVVLCRTGRQYSYIVSAYIYIALPANFKNRSVQTRQVHINSHAYTYIHHRILLAVGDMTMSGWKSTISLTHPPTTPAGAGGGGGGGGGWGRCGWWGGWGVWCSSGTSFGGGG